MKYALILVISIFLPISSVFANVYDSSGFGNSEANGCWEPTTPSGGSTIEEYVNVDGASHWHMSYNVDTYWRIDISVANYYGPDLGSVTPVGVFWINNGGGTPLGSFTFRDSSSSCGGGGGGGGTTTTSYTSATSTEALLGSLAFGQAILIVLLSLMVVGFVWNNMTDKKPWR